MSVPSPESARGGVLRRPPSVAPPRVDERDCVVVGGNLAGLTVAWLCAELGYDVTLVERGRRLGGMDASFANRNGRVFDHGLHALDHMRSELVTKLFLRVARGAVRRVVRRRGVVLRDHVLPYDAPPERWPAELRALLPQGPLRDELGSAPPTRENLARFYGRPFVDFVFDEVLGSYPSELRHLEFGAEEHQLVTNVYPWFFPAAERAADGATASRAYHERMRGEARELMLYPERGGFGGFADAFRARLEEAGVELLTGADDLSYDVDGTTRSVTAVRTRGRELRGRRVYWCGPPGPLCGLLGRAVPDAKPDWFLLGSFELDEPVRCPYTELIVGAREHRINRISFPAKLGGGRDDLVQVEFAHPRASGDFSEDPGSWLDDWLESLRRLGIVGPTARVVDFDFKRFPTLYNCFGVEGVPMPEVELELPEGSNLRPVLPSIRSINLSTRVPQFLEYVVRDLAGGRP